MIDRLDELIGQVAAVHSKLILLVDSSDSGKPVLLRDLGRRRGVPVLNVGRDLSARLATLPVRNRALSAPNILQELTAECSEGALVLIYNIEILFDRTLRLDPLALLKHLSRASVVVAVWPGDLNPGRLLYAARGHPEFQDYDAAGLVTFAVG